MNYTRNPIYVERDKRMKADRDRGMSYTDLSVKYGVSRQRVCQICANSNPAHFQFFSPERCIFNNLRDFLNRNKISVSAIVRKSGLTNSAATQTRWAKLLNGENEFRKRDIDVLINVTVMTYEELFKEGEL